MNIAKNYINLIKFHCSTVLYFTSYANIETEKDNAQYLRDNDFKKFKVFIYLSDVSHNADLIHLLQKQTLKKLSNILLQKE